VHCSSPDWPDRTMARPTDMADCVPLEEEAAAAAERSSESSEVSPPPAKRQRTGDEEAAPTAEMAAAPAREEPSSALVAAPYPLVAREAECAELDSFLESSLDGATHGGCLYVSGGPGTGKTCSVRLAAKNWQQQHPETRIVEVNCMELAQRTMAGLFQRLASLPLPGGSARSGRSGAAGGAPQDASGPKRSGMSSGRSGQGLAAAAVARLTALAPRVVLVLDEVDQLVRRQQPAASSGSTGGHSLETLFSLPRLPGAPAIALVAIANAVDLLLQRGAPQAAGLCQDLRFQPYGADQLRRIVKARLAAAGPAGEAAEKALGKVAVELRIRQVAKRSGDCRPVVCLCEQALFEEGRTREAAEIAAAEAAAAEAAAAEAAAAEAARGSPAPATPPSGPRGASSSSSSAGEPRPSAIAQLTPAKRAAPGKDPASGDPLAAIAQLPMEQQVLLCALTGSKGEALRFADLCARYKEMCRKLHQKENLTSKQQVTGAVSALEQRGLLSLRSKKGGGRGRPAGGNLNMGESVVELAVSCTAVRERVSQASPLLQKCLE